jgi:hypothetical protein
VSFKLKRTLVEAVTVFLDAIFDGGRLTSASTTGLGKIVVPINSDGDPKTK